VTAIAKRAAFLSANPQESAFLPLLGKDFGKNAAQIFAETVKAAGDKGHPLGPSATKLADASNAMAAQLMMGSLLGEPPKPEVLLAQYRGTLDKGGFACPGGDKAGLSCVTPDGRLDVSKLGPALDRFPAFFEGSLEFVIGMSAKLLTGDEGKDIDQLSKQLDNLKLQKKALIAQLIARSGSIMGMQMTQAETTKKAKEAQESQHNFMLAVAIVAVVVSVFTMGASAAILASTPGLSGTAGMWMFVCMNAGPLATVASNSPQIMEASSKVADAIGLSDMASWLKKKSDDTNDWMKDNPGVTYTLVGIQIAFAVAQSVVAGASGVTCLALSAASAVNGVAQGSLKIAASIEAKKVAELTYQLEMVSQALALLQVEIRKLMLKLDGVKQEESNIKDDIADHQDTQSKVMDSMGKAADSLAAMRAAIVSA
jgi:hypothetical protein